MVDATPLGSRTYFRDVVSFYMLSNAHLDVCRPAASRVLDAELLWRIDDRTTVETIRCSSSPAMRVFVVVVIVQNITHAVF